MMQRRQSFANTAGFTLIEVLITTVILAVGLLGIASLQLKGLQFNHDAAMRGQVSTLAYDVADRMRLSNIPASYVGAYAVPTVSPVCAAAGHLVYGNSLVNVATDLACWHKAVFDVLPPGSFANITANGDEYEISLGWTDKENNVRQIRYTFTR